VVEHRPALVAFTALVLPTTFMWFLVEAPLLIIANR